MIRDIVLANWVNICTFICIILVIGVMHLAAKWFLPTNSDTNNIGYKEVAQGFKVVWICFLAIVIAISVSGAIYQSINYIPHQQEDRQPTDKDQKNFEDHIKDHIRKEPK